ncbi:hypothetical protein T01_12727 [Trichinella spiralis]|uniref:Uncharacterized protein n=1 Tax=Trichinella spiralis TaxID=6334 RepID=A0A0V1AR02_TRISP|nr:hypothetical protein T01_12727 [Trichinella spiralis]
MLSTKRVLIQRLSPHLNHCSQIERHCSIVIYNISDKPGSCAVQIIKQKSFFSPFGSSFITNFLTASSAVRGTMTGCSTSTAVTSLASLLVEQCPADRHLSLCFLWDSWNNVRLIYIHRCDFTSQRQFRFLYFLNEYIRLSFNSDGLNNDCFIANCCNFDFLFFGLLFKIPLCNDLLHDILFLFFFSESSRLIFSAALRLVELFQELLSLVELAFLSIPNNKVVDQCKNNHNENRGECIIFLFTFRFNRYHWFFSCFLWDWWNNVRLIYIHRCDFTSQRQFRIFLLTFRFIRYLWFFNVSSHLSGYPLSLVFRLFLQQLVKQCRADRHLSLFLYFLNEYIRLSFNSDGLNNDCFIANCCNFDFLFFGLLFKIPLCNDLLHDILFLFFFSESSRLIFSAALRLVELFQELLSLVELAFLSIPNNKVVDQCKNNHNENRGECIFLYFLNEYIRLSFNSDGLNNDCFIANCCMSPPFRFSCSYSTLISFWTSSSLFWIPPLQFFLLLLFKIPLCNDLPHDILFLFFFSESSRLIFSAALRLVELFQELLSLVELAFLSIPNNKVVDQCKNNHNENRVIGCSALSTRWQAPMAALAVTLSQQRRTSLRRKNQFITAHEQQFLLCCWKASKSTVPDAVYHALELVPHWKVTGGFYLGEGIACQLIVNLLKDFPRTVV